MSPGAADCVRLSMPLGVGIIVWLVAPWLIVQGVFVAVPLIFALVASSWLGSFYLEVSSIGPSRILIFCVSIILSALVLDLEGFALMYSAPELWHLALYSVTVSIGCTIAWLALNRFSLLFVVGVLIVTTVWLGMSAGADEQSGRVLLGLWTVAMSGLGVLKQTRPKGTVT